MKDFQREYDDAVPELPPAFDRRQRERIELAIPIRILSCGYMAEKSDVGTCTDLSEGGVSFKSDAHLNVGELVILEFHQKGETTYRCNARLAYRLGQRYGAYFLTGD